MRLSQITRGGLGRRGPNRFALVALAMTIRVISQQEGEGNQPGLALGVRFSKLGSLGVFL